MPNANLRFLLASLLVALLGGLLFMPGLPGEFLFDDYQNIVNNQSIQLTELSAGALADLASMPQPSGSMRMLPVLSFALDFWRAGGMEPGVFKATNILIHALTAALLVWLFRSVLLAAGTPEARTRWLAPAMALAWAAHPLQVSAVLYTVQRMQTMGTLFIVMALLAYLQARRAQIAGTSGRAGLMVAMLAWMLALNCKEDSVLLPAYTLALELTVLRFAAREPAVAQRWRRGYLFATIAAAALFLWIMVPHYWSWEAYPGRDFSTFERLLTQGRVLCLYLWQIMLPLPSHMPFYYDWLQPSRGLLHPWTTLPSIALLLGLLGTAWWLRARQPLFALGLLLFFAAHFMTSNVIGLELAYEHRNHFALIGAVLAIGSLLEQAARPLRMRPAARAAAIGAVLAFLGGTTALRAHEWSSKLSLASAATQAAPGSARAWIQLCATQLELGGGPVPGNTRLNAAIVACSEGAARVPDSLNSPALLLVLKTLRGDIRPDDWDGFRERMRTSGKSWDNYRAPTLLTYNAQQGVPLDKQQLLRVFATQLEVSDLQPRDLAGIGDFIMVHLVDTDAAMPYFTRVIAAIPANDPFAGHLIAELNRRGRPDLSRKIQNEISNQVREKKALHKSFAAPASASN